jgi:hypothetical protein
MRVCIQERECVCRCLHMPSIFHMYVRLFVSMHDSVRVRVRVHVRVHVRVRVLVCVYES